MHDQQGLYVTNSKENEAKLTINRMLQIYQGIFTCMATNTLGQDSRLVRVIPKRKKDTIVFLLFGNMVPYLFYLIV